MEDTYYVIVNITKNPPSVKYYRCNRLCPLLRLWLKLSEMWLLAQWRLRRLK